jgi:Zn-finger nucleic acid-binding protein
MDEQSHGGVQLDLCHHCPGVWFDGGELKAYQASEGSPVLENVPGPDDVFEPTGDSAHVKCPGCGHDILRKWIAGHHSVMRCTTCGGLFLPLPDPNHNAARPDNVLSAAITAFEEIVPWLLGKES